MMDYDRHEQIGYDWAEVWGYAAGKNSQYTDPQIESVDGTPTHPFDYPDLLQEYGRSEGENDESDWLIWGQLKDGRWFFIEAGCDYTGWDCRADGRAWVANSREALVRGGMGDEARHRLGLGEPTP